MYPPPSGSGLWEADRDRRQRRVGRRVEGVVGREVDGIEPARARRVRPHVRRRPSDGDVLAGRAESGAVGFRDLQIDWAVDFGRAERDRHGADVVVRLVSGWS